MVPLPAGRRGSGLQSLPSTSGMQEADELWPQSALNLGFSGPVFSSFNEN